MRPAMVIWLLGAAVVVALGVWLWQWSNRESDDIALLMVEALGDETAEMQQAAERARERARKRAARRAWLRGW